jgi:MFS transporter, NNP family, nitrate/nitrite transporter
VLGAIFGRIGMGTILDVVGPRLGNAIVMLLFAPPVFLISMITNAEGFQAIRLFIGMSLCCFVCCQQWVGSMFNVNIVGTANAIAAGWGNLGGGEVGAAVLIGVVVLKAADKADRTDALPAGQLLSF